MRTGMVQAIIHGRARDSRKAKITALHCVFWMFCDTLQKRVQIRRQAKKLLILVHSDGSGIQEENGLRFRCGEGWFGLWAISVSISVSRISLFERLVRLRCFDDLFSSYLPFLDRIHSANQ